MEATNVTSAKDEKQVSIKSIPKTTPGTHNLVGKGKTERDNELISSTLNCNGKIKVEKVELENGITYEGEWLNGMLQIDTTIKQPLG